MVIIIWHQKNELIREILIKLYTEGQNAHTKQKNNWWKQECGIKWQANMEIFFNIFIFEKNVAMFIDKYFDSMRL